jgi:hypothetical protein
MWYASVLSERMKREIEEKEVVPDSQTGFRKGRGTMDTVYILDHLAKSELKKKTKMMVLNKRKRKSEENDWKWEESKIERVNKFKYLGYTFNERTTEKAHMREIARKENKVVGYVWGIGERIVGRRMMMCESMIESVSMYGAEIWDGRTKRRYRECKENI